MLADGRLKVSDALSAAAGPHAARRDGGASAAGRRAVAPRCDDRNSGAGQRIWLATAGRARCAGCASSIVDDGSATPIRHEDFARLHCDIEVLRHAQSKGPAAARNTGLAACKTDFVAFLDSDVVPRRGWLEALLGHFCDPTVALVAPRIVGLAQTDNWSPATRRCVRRWTSGSGRRRWCPYGTRVLCAQCRDHLPSHGACAISVASTRPCDPVRTSTSAGGSSRPVPGFAMSRLPWWHMTIGQNCGIGLRARLSTVVPQPRCRFVTRTRPRRW